MFEADFSVVPRHIAFIMDGNGRWAKARGQERVQGHFAGTQAVIKVVKHAFERGVKYVTLYAFSTENWKRPAAEIDALMSLLVRFLQEHENLFLDNKIRLETIGDLSALPEQVRAGIADLKEKTADFEERTVVVALNYSSRNEILNAAKNYAAAVAAGTESSGTPDWPTFSKYLYTEAIPDPDLIVRTSGELRLSNFLLVQAAYAELYFTRVLWPDFDERELDAALIFYASRERRFGKISEQIQKKTDL
ncbi:MAG: di-trans,poly-cis-decaprenylcistransferase [Opitutales bacterium]|nr:di-trans,poly-cis-decaprenylcistransferase [Opitutales bacterium]